MVPIPENRKLPKREADLFKSILVRLRSLCRCISRCVGPESIGSSALIACIVEKKRARGEESKCALCATQGVWGIPNGVSVARQMSRMVFTACLAWPETFGEKTKIAMSIFAAHFRTRGDANCLDSNKRKMPALSIALAASSVSKTAAMLNRSDGTCCAWRHPVSPAGSWTCQLFE